MMIPLPRSRSVLLLVIIVAILTPIVATVHRPTTHDDLTLKRLEHHTRPRLPSTQIPMQRVQEPCEKLVRVTLLEDLEAALARVGDFLEEFVRGDLAFECAWVPELADEKAEAFD